MSSASRMAHSSRNRLQRYNKKSPLSSAFTENSKLTRRLNLSFTSIKGQNSIFPTDVSSHSLYPINKGNSDEGFTSVLPSTFFQLKKVSNSNLRGHSVVLICVFEWGLESFYERTAVLLKKDCINTGFFIRKNRVLMGYAAGGRHTCRPTSDGGAPDEGKPVDDWWCLVKDVPFTCYERWTGHSRGEVRRMQEFYVCRPPTGWDNLN
jgi:hypothetical protein